MHFPSFENLYKELVPETGKERALKKAMNFMLSSILCL